MTVSEFVRRLRANASDKDNWTGLFGKMLKDDVLEACKLLEAENKNRMEAEKAQWEGVEEIKQLKVRLEALLNKPASVECPKCHTRIKTI